MNKFRVFILLTVGFIASVLLSQSLLDHRIIIKKYFSDYHAHDISLEMHELDKSTIVKKMTPTQFTIYKKEKQDFIITKNHLKVSSYGIKAVSNKAYNLKNIKYSLDSSGSNKKYSVNNIFDNDLSTTWVDNDKGRGIGRWVRLNISNEYEDKSNRYNYKTYPYIIIFPGYGKTTELFYQNNRLKSALLFVATTNSIYTDENSSGEIEKNIKYVRCERLVFDDEPKYHLFRLPSDPSLEGTNFIFMLFIEDVYDGSKYNDTCISEIQLVW